MTSRPADGDLTGALLTIAREVLEEPRLTADDDLTAFGGTSLALVRIVAVAHERAVRILPHRAAVVGQIPLMVLMIGYTVGGLSLLFTG